MSIAKKAISGAIWMSGISYGGFAINFGIQLVLVRLLVPEDFGIFALGLSIAEILFIFFGFSYSMAVIQIQKTEDLFDTAFYLSIFSGLVMIIIGGITSLLISTYYPLQSVLTFFVLCAIQPINACSAIYSASMEKELQFKKNAIVRGVATNFSGFAAIFMAYTGFGVWSLVGREIITGIFMLLAMRMVSSYRFRRKFSWDTAKKLIVFGYKVLFSRGLEIVYHRIPNFFIGTFAGLRALGLFSQTYYLANLPNTILAPAHQNVAYATYSKIQNDKEKINKAFYITNYFFIRLLMPLMIVLFLYPKEILKYLYGDKWVDASLILSYFSIYAAFLPLFSNAKSFAYSLGRILEVGKTYLIAIILLSMGTFIALYTGKIYLMALTYSLSLLFALIIAMRLLKRNGIKLYLRRLFFVPIIVFLSLIVISLLLFSPHNIIPLSGKISTLFFLLITYVVFTIIIFICEPKNTVENIRYIYRRLYPVA